MRELRVLWLLEVVGEGKVRSLHMRSDGRVVCDNLECPHLVSCARGGEPKCFPVVVEYRVPEIPPPECGYIVRYISDHAYYTPLWNYMPRRVFKRWDEVKEYVKRLASVIDQPS
jgi:hypothetical protein